MKYLDYRKAIGALAAVVMVIGVSADTAQAANIYAVEALSSHVHTEFFKRCGSE